MSESNNDLGNVKEGAEDGTDQHITSEVITGTSGKGFVGILIALVALGVLFWVYSRLIATYPGQKSPEEAAANAGGAAQTTESGSSPSTDAPSEGKDAMDSPTHDMSKMGSTGDKGGTMSGGSSFQTRLASFPVDKCPECGMTPSKSSAMVGAQVDGKWTGFASFGCLLEYSDGKNVGDIEVLDYSTRMKDPSERKMLLAKDAYFLIDVEGKVKGSMPPGVAAFASEADAKAAIGDLGGRVARFDEAKAFVEKEIA